MTKNKDIIFNANNIKLVDNDWFVMMDWETELMQQHAKRVTQKGGDVLEIGFGMGISAQFIQEYGCKSHTIVESHPKILEKLKKWSADKPNVRIVEGDWFELINTLTQQKYDGIWYDADCAKGHRFRERVVDKCLKHGGIFTYFDPKGKDKYRYGELLNLDLVKITAEIPKNEYHNDNDCFCPYVINV